MLIKEQFSLLVENPVFDPRDHKEATQLATPDFKVSEVRAIYPMIKALNSGRLTRNYTFYPRETLLGKFNTESPKGYSSFVYPYGKPIITEHRLQDYWDKADVPMGRVVAAGYKKAGKDDPQTSCSKSYMPGTVEGDGYLWLIPSITCAESIQKILSGIYHTVSIGSRVESVVESISGLDLIKLNNEGKEMPAFVRGQVYDNKLSYWTLYGLEGQECSYVNNPADVRAGTIETDLGYQGLQLLIGEKKLGAKEFSFYDMKTKKEVKLDCEEMAVDQSFCTDSLPPLKEFTINPPALFPLFNNTGMSSQESTPIKEGDIVSWKFGEGRILSIHSIGLVPGVQVSIEATETNKVARIQVFKEGRPTEKFVAHRIQYLKRIDNENH